MTSSQCSAIFWMNYNRAHISVVDKMFVGQLQQTVQCKQCGLKSTSAMPFKDISVHIFPSLRIAIQNFLAAGELDSEELYNCL
mmetsp:Transcript_26156/g.25337  ORF Transcript_26156/g.25337 Transcript_26156/m.25337 type:complete len:83 (+) Transcript_26156:1419-1667(+)